MVGATLPEPDELRESRLIHLIVVPLVALLSVLFLLPVVAAMLSAYIWDSEHPQRAHGHPLSEQHLVGAQPEPRLRRRLP